MPCQLQPQSISMILLGVSNQELIRDGNIVVLTCTQTHNTFAACMIKLRRSSLAILTAMLYR